MLHFQKIDQVRQFWHHPASGTPLEGWVEQWPRISCLLDKYRAATPRPSNVAHTASEYLDLLHSFGIRSGKQRQVDIEHAYRALPCPACAEQDKRLVRVQSWRSVWLSTTSHARPPSCMVKMHNIGKNIIFLWPNQSLPEIGIISATDVAEAQPRESGAPHPTDFTRVDVVALPASDPHNRRYPFSTQSWACVIAERCCRQPKLQGETGKQALGGGNAVTPLPQDRRALNF